MDALLHQGHVGGNSRICEKVVVPKTKLVHETFVLPTLTSPSL